MLIFAPSLRVCLALDPVELRKSFDGMAAHVQHAVGEDKRSAAPKTRKQTRGDHRGDEL
jgi:hypothetical protein